MTHDQQTHAGASAVARPADQDRQQVLRDKYHHGRSPAAWAGSVVAAIGFILATVGFLMNINWPIVWVGLALVLVAAIVGYVMVKLGKGQVWE